MIPKAIIHAVAKEESLRDTTIEKDYVLGWMLHGVAVHPRLSRWVFKGGTCLKKCFFETYRFSEDLDFTALATDSLDVTTIEVALREVCNWVAAESGIEFPSQRIDVEEYANKQGTASFQAKVTYVGPLKLARHSLQRIKFDVTQHELLVDPPDHRRVFHRYPDAPEPSATIACYSVNEILAEKTRALYERQGRARDVYDVVHICRSFRDDVSPARAREILAKKFEYKRLPPPSVEAIFARIDSDSLRANWEQQLAHQLPALPSIDNFMSDLRDLLTWWMEPSSPTPQTPRLTVREGESIAPQRFPVATLDGVLRARGQLHGEQTLERIRFAARNRLCVELTYDGVPRRVEPYSLRRSTEGALRLYVHELTRDGEHTEQLKSYTVDRIDDVTIAAQSFVARWAIEL
jgi:predicted nucleotidyltransferase component of viral defense system